MDTKKLRQKILDLAIRGKLVPQDPNDEPASVLLERIRAEKEQLIKEGKIKRSKKSAASDISHYENYELPQGWTYATMSDICTKIVDGDHNPPIAQKAESEYIMISSKNVVNDSIIHLDDVRHLSRADFELSNARTQVSKGDVLFTSVASLGRTCIYDLDYPITFQRSVTVICTKIFNRYLKLFLDSPLYQNYVGENARGTAQKGFYINQISDSWVPIPPLNEQIRIVEKAQSLLDIVQIINYSKEETSNNIIALKSKILDLAISGKLVRQDKSNEPAIELLKRINPQYQPTDNRHYENLPQNWEECALKDIVEIQNGYAFKSSLYSNDGVRVIRITNVQDGYIMDDSPKYYPLSHMDGLEDYMLKGNDLLMSLTGNVGRVAMMPAGLLPAALNQRVCCITPKSSEVCKEFLFYLLRTDSFITSCIESGKGVAQLNVSTEWLKSYRIALPPKDEQRRIVKAIQNIMTKIDKILADL